MPENTYLVNQNINKKYRLNGIFPSKRLPDKFQLNQSFKENIIYGASELPSRVDLRSDMTTVEDQSTLASCTANALAGAYEFLIKKADGNSMDVSRLFMYYNARVKDHPSEPVTDSGCSMTSAIEALEEKGVCNELTWPYDASNVNTQPNEQAYSEGESLKIIEALRVEIDLTEMKSCLAQGFPFVFGLTLFGTFDKAAQTGIVPMPSANDTGRTAHGYHAMLAVGYSDQTNAFIVRNSWGETWGEKGYCYIPYDYLANSDYSFDIWTVKKISTNSNIDKESWQPVDYDKKTEVDNNVYYDNDNNDNNYTIETYEEGDNYDYSNIIDPTYEQYNFTE